MKKLKIKLDFGDFAAFGTWALLLGLSLYILDKNSAEILASPWLIISLFVGYIICFYFITNENLIVDNRQLKLYLLVLQLLFAYYIMWLLPLGYLPILTIIWAAQLPHFFTLKQSFFITFAVVVCSSAIYGIHWQEKHYIMQGSLYFTFHIFSLFMMQNVKLAEEANAKSQSLNTELKATQQLLAEASRQNERTRIARDLHDLLGHHLTALIINLQVAGRLTEGDAKSRVEQCHSLAKLLLSDVREAVSTLRENHELDFRKMIELMIENIPNLKINSHIDTQLDLEDLNLAKALLSCIQESITNCLRHSGASEFWITMKCEDDLLMLELVDNGQVSGSLIKGNGLTGMSERIEALSGQLKFDIVQNSLRINISVPLKGHLNDN